MSACPFCPVARQYPDLVCPRFTRRMAQACTWVDPSHERYNPDYSPGIVRMALLDASVAPGEAEAPRTDPRLLRVQACPWRGPTLPVSEQKEGCGCGGSELTQCKAGKGADPGKVTLGECLACVNLTE